MINKVKPPVTVVDQFFPLGDTVTVQTAQYLCELACNETDGDSTNCFGVGRD